MNIAVLVSSFILGIGGSLHCMGMCGPLALSVPFANDKGSKGMRLFTYYLAKALAYGSMGAVTGYIGKGFLLMDWQQGLSIAAGIFIIIWVLLPMLKTNKGSYIFQKQFSRIFARMQQQPALRDFFALGFLNGFLPCGLVYTALATATVSGSMAGGFTAMFLFGAGTAPALVILALLKNKMSVNIRKKFKPVSMALSFGIGLLLIVRGMNLGIPYVSPHIETKTQTVKGCCAPKSQVQEVKCH